MTNNVPGTLDGQSQRIEQLFHNFSHTLGAALGTRTEELQTVFEEYVRALDAAMESRQQALDSQLVERTKVLDDAFSDRLRLFDESILRSTIAIDGSVADRTHALTQALEGHAKEISTVLGQQANQMDEQLMHGVNAVRRSSENVTRQSIKAIEGIANQTDLLRNVSENLLTQVSGVTNRFEHQGQMIMKAANALETANFRIDKTLQNRQADLSQTLDRLSGKADDVGRAMLGYSETLEGSVTDAESRVRAVGEQLSRGVEERSRLTLERDRATAGPGGQQLRPGTRGTQGEVLQRVAGGVRADRLAVLALLQHIGRDAPARTLHAVRVGRGAGASEGEARPPARGHARQRRGHAPVAAGAAQGSGAALLALITRGGAPGHLSASTAAVAIQLSGAPLDITRTHLRHRELHAGAR